MKIYINEKIQEDNFIDYVKKTPHRTSCVGSKTL